MEFADPNRKTTDSDQDFKKPPKVTQSVDFDQLKQHLVDVPEMKRNTVRSFKDQKN